MMPQNDWDSVLQTNTSVAHLLTQLQQIRQAKDTEYAELNAKLKAFEGKKVAIFGAGQAGCDFFKLAQTRCTVVCFVDNDAKKHGSLISGIEVKSAQDLDPTQIDLICVVTQFWKEIVQQLSTISTLSEVEVLVWH